MSNVVARSRNFAPAAVLCTLAGALLSLPATSHAASKTLTISGTPASTVAVQGNYSFQPTAKDTVKSRIKFDIYNKPSWATFDGTTGKLSGTPSRRDVGTYSNITIRLTDWYGYVTTPAFSIKVTDKRAAPAPVQPTPVKTTPVKTAPASSTPTTTTPVSTTPAGTTSGGSTTASTGTTSTQTAGTAPKNSGTSSQASSTGNVALDWMPPTENTDGSVLTNLAGYTVHYGTDPSSLTQTMKVSNVGITSVVVDDLTPGKWYFAISSVNDQGTESTRSAVVSTTIL